MYPGDAGAVTTLQPETEYGVIMPYQSRDLHGVVMLVSFLKNWGFKSENGRQVEMGFHFRFSTV
jgi:hypothetical protein